MKYGRLSGKDLEDVSSRLKKALSRKATHACGFVIAPSLVSERTTNGLRGEIRIPVPMYRMKCITFVFFYRLISIPKACFASPKSENTCNLGRKIEDKFDAKNLSSFYVNIRTTPPPQQKKVPISYFAWIVIPDSALDSNVFCASQLFQDRSGHS